MAHRLCWVALVVILFSGCESKEMARSRALQDHAAESAELDRLLNERKDMESTIAAQNAKVRALRDKWVADKLELYKIDPSWRPNAEAQAREREMEAEFRADQEEIDRLGKEKLAEIDRDIAEQRKHLQQATERLDKIRKP